VPAQVQDIGISGHPTGNPSLHPIVWALNKQWRRGKRDGGVGCGASFTVSPIMSCWSFGHHNSGPSHIYLPSTWRPAKTANCSLDWPNNFLINFKFCVNCWNIPWCWWCLCVPENFCFPRPFRFPAFPLAFLRRQPSQMKSFPSSLNGWANCERGSEI